METTAVDRKSLLERSIVKSFFLLGAPTIAHGFLASGFNIVDMAYVGRLGAAELAAVSVGGIVSFILYTVAAGISIGTLSLVSRYWGGRRYDMAALVLAQSIYLSIIVSFFFSLKGWYLAKPFLYILGARGEVHDMSIAYFKIICLGSASIFVAGSFAAALRGAGDTTTPLKVISFAFALNIVLDPILIFGLLGVPAMGVAGSALATVIARMVSLAILAWVVLRRHALFDLSGAFNIIRWPLIGHIIRIGFYSTMEMVIQTASGLVFLRIVAPFGTVALAAYGIGIRLQMLVTKPGVGVGYASGILVGQSLGAGMPHRARRSSWYSLMLFEIVLLPIVVMFLAFPGDMVGFFNKDSGVVCCGSQFLVCVALSMFFVAATIVLGMSMNSAGDTRSPMIITAIGMFGIGIPLAYTWSHFRGIEGVWLAILLSSAVEGLLMMVWFKRGRWLKQEPLKIY